MKKKEEKSNVEWYDNAYAVTNSIIGLIILIIVLSQAFAVSNNLSTINIFRNIVNHNSIYFLLLIYFCSIKFNYGKRYFDHFNIFLLIIYFIGFISSLLTVFQAFSLSTILLLAMDFVVFIYLFHTMLRGSRIWKEFKLGNSPFNELTNDWYFSTIIVIAVILLAVNLIFTTSFAGAILSIFDCIYMALFSRYIYLYRDYLDSKKINSKNDGDFSKYTEMLNDKVDDISNKFTDFVEDNNIDDIGENVKKKVVDFVEDNDIDDKIDDIKKKATDFVSENDKKFDNTIDNVASKVTDFTKGVSKKIDDFIEESNIDDGIEKAINKVGDLIDDVKKDKKEVKVKKEESVVESTPKKKRRRKKKSNTTVTEKGDK